MPLSLRFVAHSETGLVRKNNQDSGYASPHLLVVADGMGGAAAGDLASAVAIDAIRKVDARVAGEQMLEVLAGALHQANDRIADLVNADYALEGMGTTVTGALFDGAELGLAHIGDSRAYLFRDGRLERLTHDHSWVQSLVDDGRISEEEATLHPHRSLLIKVLNGQPANDPDLTRLTLQLGDRLLFCSDGLCGLVDDPDIEAALRLPDLEGASRRLVQLAHAAGGIDNITLIVGDVVDAGGTENALILGAAADRELPTVESLQRQATASPLDDHEDTVVTARPQPTATAPAGHVEDEARYDPRPPQQRRRLRTLAGALALVVLLSAGATAAWAWTRTQYYVGAASEQVAIFQGLAEGLPGVRLSRVYEVQQLPIRVLPPYYQERVRSGIPVANVAAARQTVTELAQAAKRCASQAAPTPTPRPTPARSTAAVRSPAPRPSPARSTAPVRTTAPQPSPRAPTPPTKPVPSTSTLGAGPTKPSAAAPTSPSTATPEPTC